MLRRQPGNIQRRNGHAFSRASRSEQAHRVGLFNNRCLFELWLYGVRRSRTRIARAGRGKASRRRCGLLQEIGRKFCKRGLNSIKKNKKTARWDLLQGNKCRYKDGCAASLNPYGGCDGFDVCVTNDSGYAKRPISAKRPLSRLKNSAPSHLSRWLLVSKHFRLVF